MDSSQLHCEFCTEFKSFSSSRIKRIYGNRLDNRVVAKSNRIVAMPSIGQIFPGSLMILPIDHVETIADLSDSSINDIIILFNKLYPSASHYGSPVLFEHGAKCITGGGCGIYHAHLHLVPVPTSIACSEFLPDWKIVEGNLNTIYKLLKYRDQYLLFMDSHGKLAYHIVDPLDLSIKFESQFLRKKLSKYFNSLNDWNWKNYNIERSLLEAFSVYSSLTLL